MDFVSGGRLDVRLRIFVFLLLLLLQNENVRTVPNRLLLRLHGTFLVSTGWVCAGIGDLKSSLMFDDGFMIHHFLPHISGLMCGTFGYVGTSAFVRKIYSTVKIDWYLQLKNKEIVNPINCRLFQTFRKSVYRLHSDDGETYANEWGYSETDWIVVDT